MGTKVALMQTHVKIIEKFWNLFFVCFNQCFHFAEDEISKLSLLEISRKLVLNVISIDEKIFKYTCNEAGIRCNPDMHTRGLMGYLQEIEKKLEV